MKRILALLLLLVGLATPVLAQSPALRVIIVDPTGTHAASVSGGNVGTAGSASVTVDTISHITSAVHVAGIASTVSVNCVIGCSASSSTHTAVTQAAQPWTIAHIAAAVHVVVGGRPGVAAHQAGTWTVDVNSGTVTVSGTVAATQSGAWNVAAAQSGTWMIAAAHIIGGSGHLAVTQGAAQWNVNCVVGCSASSSDTVNVFHQSTIRHISSVTHVYVVDLPRSAHLGAAQSGLWNVSAHIIGGTGHMAVTLAGGGHLAITQAAANLNVTCSNCTGGSSDAVNVFHQSTIRHISSVTHIQSVGRLGVDAHQGGSWTVAATQSGAYNVSAAQSGSFTVQAAHQGGEWTVRHISGALHVSGITNVGSGASGTNPMACHTTVAFSTTTDLVLAHSQNSMRIFICAVILVAAGAENVSIVEGTGTTCATGLRGIIGGFGGTMALAANGGFSSIAPFPWIASSVAGNQVCLDKSGSGNVSGTITYRGAP